MYLSPGRVLHLQRVMELLAARLPADELRTELARPVLGLLDADFYASYVWDNGQGRFARGVACNVDPVHGRRYEDCFQFDDPLTPVLHARRVPTRVTDVLPQRALLTTPFWHDFLRPDGLYWGINAYAHDGRRDLGDLRVWRRRGRPNFDSDDVALLRTIYPALVRALQLDDGQPPFGAPLPSGAALVALLLARTPLSRREAEVATLACEGRSDKDIARALQIGFTTVRSHLAAAFRKLGCEGRTCLAYRVAQLVLQ